MSLSLTERPRTKGTLPSAGVVNIDQILSFEGSYLRTPSICHYDPWKKAADSTVFISADRNRPHGSGIIVNHHGRKYLITATHVLGPKALSKPTDLKVFERNENAIRVTNLEDKAMLYSTPLAAERNLPNADVGVFSYDGPIEGVPLVESLESSDYISAAIGYPGIHTNVWTRDLQPLVSPGRAFIEQQRKTELTSYMRKLMEEHGLLGTPEPVQKAVFTGATARGNSSGGLFTLDGKLLGICRGPQGTIGKETGLQEFYTLHEALKAIDPRTI